LDLPVAAADYTDQEARAAWEHWKRQPITESNFLAICDLMRDQLKPDMMLTAKFDFGLKDVSAQSDFMTIYLKGTAAIRLPCSRVWVKREGVEIRGNNIFLLPTRAYSHQIDASL
jgi:hypothetical protein